MKKGLEVWTDYDEAGIWRLHIKKKKGPLTINEIKDAAREWEWDYYLSLLDCYHDEGGDDQLPLSSPPPGDHVVLYRTEDLRKSTTEAQPWI